MQGSERPTHRRRSVGWNVDLDEGARAKVTADVRARKAVSIRKAVSMRCRIASLACARMIGNEIFQTTRERLRVVIGDASAPGLLSGER